MTILHFSQEIQYLTSIMVSVMQVFLIVCLLFISCCAFTFCGCYGEEVEAIVYKGVCCEKMRYVPR